MGKKKAQNQLQQKKNELLANETTDLGGQIKLDRDGKSLLNRPGDELKRLWKLTKPHHRPQEKRRKEGAQNSESDTLETSRGSLRTSKTPRLHARLL